MSEEGAYLSPDGPEPHPIGTIVHNRYRILGVVGRGGLGVVYRVADILYSAHNVYALKELSDTSPGARKQFELESRWLQELDHNSIPRVRESFEWEDRVYLVMDFVDGENLEQYLRRTGKPLPEEQALRWMLPICDALQYLHTRTPPLLHRDVKPANIIVTPGGHPVLVDFGIAKAHLPGMNQTVTFVRKAGTEGYAPPEQYAATGLTGPWSDVYGLGATLYQLLTGQVPQTAVERITGVSPMPRPRTLNPAISPLIDAAILRALELKPANRYQTVTEFAAQMMEALQRGRFAASGPGAPAFNSVSSGPDAPAFNAPVSGPGVGPFNAATSQPPLRPPATPAATSAPPTSWPSAYRGAPASPPAPATRVSANLPPLGAPIPSNLPAASPSPAAGQSFAPGGPSGPHSPLSPSAPSTPRMTQLDQRGRHAPPASARVTASRLTEEKPRRGLMRSLAILGALAAVAVVAALAFFVVYPNYAPPDRSTPQTTVTGYFDALEQQNYTRAWDFSSASRNDPAAQSSFTSALTSDDARYGKVISFTITQSQSDNAGHTDETVSVTRANAPNAPLTYDVSVTLYSGPTWLIDSASSQ